MARTPTPGRCTHDYEVWTYTMTLEDIAIRALVAVAAGYLVLQVIRFLRGKPTGSCGCDGCGSGTTHDNNAGGRITKLTINKTDTADRVADGP